MNIDLGICLKCQKRKATTYWVGDSGMLGFAHGMGQPWCELCCAKAQLYYAIQSILQIPRLREEIAKLEKEET